MRLVLPLAVLLLALPALSGCTMIGRDGCSAGSHGGDGRNGDGTYGPEHGWVDLCGTHFSYDPALGAFRVNATEDLTWTHLSIQGPSGWHVAVGRPAKTSDPDLKDKVDLGDVAQGRIHVGDLLRLCSPTSVKEFSLTFETWDGAGTSTGFSGGSPPRCQA